MGANKEVPQHAIAACLYGSSVATVRCALCCAHLAEGPGVAGGGHAGARPAHRVLGSAGAGSAGAAGFCPLPPCAQPGRVVATGSQPRVAEPAAASSGPGHRAAGAGDRRNRGTPQGETDCGQGSLSKWRAFLARSLRQGHGSALGQPAVAGGDPLAAAGVGPAFSPRAGPLHPLPCCTGAPPPYGHGLGAPDAVLCAALAARARPGGGGRPGQPGRPRLKGARLPSLHTVWADPATAWIPLRQQWPDGTLRRLEYVSATAVWYPAGHPPVPLRWLLIRDPAQKQEPQALLSTDPALAPAPDLVPVPAALVHGSHLAAVRTYWGVETQRPGSHQAILRTTPALLGLCSWLALATHVRPRGQPVAPRRAAWYAQQHPTFSDVLAFMRQTLWRRTPLFRLSPFPTDNQKPAQHPLPTIMETLCYTA